MIEKDIECRIVSAMKQLNLEDTQILNSWNDGKSLTNIEDESSTTIIDIKTTPRQYDTAQIPTASIGCSIEVTTREEQDPTGETMLEVSEKVMEILQLCQESLDFAIQAFELPTFSVAGFRLDGGSGPYYDKMSGKTSLQLNFTIRGVVQHF